MSIISVSVKGLPNALFKSNNNKPAVAEVIKCQYAESCSLFQEGKCALLDNVFSAKCHLGTKENIKGFTPRAKKYREFINQWQGHEKYQALKSSKSKVFIADDSLMVLFTRCYVTFDENNNLVMNSSKQYNPSYAKIPLNLLTLENLKTMVLFEPSNLWGEVFKDYQKDEVPAILTEIKILLPELFESFHKRYKLTSTKNATFIGKKAYLNTIAPSKIIVKNYDKKVVEVWNWDGTYLTPIDVQVDFKIAKNPMIVDLIIKPKEDTIIEISDDNQVTDDTKFV